MRCHILFLSPETDLCPPGTGGRAEWITRFIRPLARTHKKDDPFMLLSDLKFKNNYVSDELLVLSCWRSCSSAWLSCLNEHTVYLPICRLSSRLILQKVSIHFLMFLCNTNDGLYKATQFFSLVGPLCTALVS